ncbi:hypothetical protein VMCG_07994 [Cytospora schulzeri]|uniref:Wax synthase domain-containing protein n=1 Tax=Cytospora schulzeri TaxID=448051 RepID=A0A423VY42_9PEZI|nr:hypothetical protein VMCG_07994 [Valsa malicola]
MGPDLPASPFRSMLTFVYTEAAFLACFAVVILNTPAQATTKRAAGLVILGATTCVMESIIVPLCLTNGRPHWAATVASLLWVQFLSASDLVLVSRVHAGQLPRAYHGSGSSRAKAVSSAIGLLWNVRRVRTPWEVKNVPSTAGLQTQSRTTFVLRRIGVTLLAYIFVDVVVSLPPPDLAMVRPDKATLFSLRGLGVDDIIFRIIMTISYWLTTGILNLFMTNVGAIVSVLLGLSRPVDCPPLYGPFSEAYSIRRFWGVSWHQMFRCFLTGHASLIVDNLLPFFPRRSAASRYARLTVAFLIAGLIHYHADQLMGVPDAENGALIFFFLHAAFIMLEDALRPALVALLPTRIHHAVGCLWVVSLFVWSSPVWTYSGTRLGIDSAALLPVRVVGPWVQRSLGTA